MSTTFTTHPTPLHRRHVTAIRSALPTEPTRRKIISTFLVTSSSLALSLGPTAQTAMSEEWGTRSFLKEKFFEPGLSPENAAARIKNTAEGLHSIREMLETMSWRYVLFYIRLKQSYLSADMKNAMNVVPESRRDSYVKTANELVDNMAEFDRYIRSPKVYESYLFYEKTLKSIDELVTFL